MCMETMSVILCYTKTTWMCMRERGHVGKCKWEIISEVGV